MKIGKHRFLLDDSRVRREDMRLLTALLSGSALLPLTAAAGLAENVTVRSGDRVTKQTSKPNTDKSNGAIMNSRHKDLILQAYAAFNRQDADALFALVSDDVDWPKDDVRLHGKDAVRAYLLEKWAKNHPHDEPVAIRDLSEERSAVHIDQVVYALDGSVISKGMFEMTFQIKDKLIVRMDLKEL
jgi:hypothetical protein